MPIASQVAAASASNEWTAAVVLLRRPGGGASRRFLPSVVCQGSDISRRRGRRSSASLFHRGSRLNEHHWPRAERLVASELRRRYRVLNHESVLHDPRKAVRGPSGLLMNPFLEVEEVCNRSVCLERQYEQIVELAFVVELTVCSGRAVPRALTRRQRFRVDRY